MLIAVALTRTDLGALRRRKQRELAEVRNQLAAARQRKAAASVEYASTSDGVCETYRRFELARGVEREGLRSLYLAGLALAEQEFERRCALGHSGDHDGPLEAVRVGSFDDPVARVLVEHQVMGSVRTGPGVGADGAASVGLVRLSGDVPRSRVRLRLHCAADAVLGVFVSTLAEVITQAWSDPQDGPRMRSFLGERASVALAEVLERGAR